MAAQEQSVLIMSNIIVMEKEISQHTCCRSWLSIPARPQPLGYTNLHGKLQCFPNAFWGILNLLFPLDFQHLSF